MPDLKEAAAQIKRFAPMMQAVIDIADAVDGLKNIEQAANEKQALIKTLAGEHDKAKAAVEAAKRKAAEIIDQAEHDASELREKAHTEANAAAARIAKKLADAEAKAAELRVTGESALETATARHAEITAAVAEKQAVLAELDAKIAEASAKVAKILGGVA